MISAQYIPQDQSLKYPSKINQKSQHSKQQFSIDDKIPTQTQSKSTPQIQTQNQIQHHQKQYLSPIHQNIIIYQPTSKYQYPSKSKNNQNQLLSITKKQLFCAIFIAVTITLIITSVLCIGTYFIIIKGYLNTNSNSNTNNLSQQPSLSIQAIALNPCDSESQSQHYQMEQNWIYFDEPKFIDSFKFDSLKQNIMSFISIIPKQTKAKYIKLTIYQRSYYPDKTYDFRFKTRVINGNNEWVHWNYGIRYSYPTYEYNSEQFIVPCLYTRQIRVKSNVTQGNAVVQYYVAGYKL